MSKVYGKQAKTYVLAQKIHLSEDADKALQNLGGYITTFRGEMNVKVGF